MLASRIKSAKKKWRRLTQGATPVIYIGCATCGLAAGAGDLLAVIDGELKRLGVQANVVPVGCIGMCFAEPLVDIRIPGQTRVCYSQVTPENLTKILKSHFLRGKPMASMAMYSPWKNMPKAIELYSV
jgi:(2Fe-2S) ferredoxin